MYLLLGQDGRVEQWSSTPQPGFIETNIESGDERLTSPGGVLFVNGDLVPLEPNEPTVETKPEPTTEERLEQLEAVVLQLMMF